MLIISPLNVCVAFAAMLGVGREAFRGHKFKGNESSLMMMMMMVMIRIKTKSDNGTDANKGKKRMNSSNLLLVGHIYVRLTELQ